jgi:hypothetical protein
MGTRMKDIMTLKEFYSLKPGDLLVWRGKYLRTVLSVGYPGSKCHSVTLSIRHRSWTNRATTVYGYHDLKWLAFPAGKKIRNLLLNSELLVLRTLKFNVRKELKREVSEAIDLKKRMRQALCDNTPKLARLAGVKI